MNTELVSISDLTPDPANARKHGERNLKAIIDSLRAFGQQKPIVVDRRGVVIAGNGTLEAAKRLGWEEIAIVRTELEPTQATAFGIADNRTAELAEWDEEVLVSLLDSLDDETRDLMHFDQKELDALVPKATVEVVEDEVPEKVEPVTKPGDLWLLGKHRLLCGDSTKADDVSRLMDGETADAIVTDPPYGIGYEYNSHDDNDNAKNASLIAEAFRHGPELKIWTPGLANLARDVGRFGEAKVAVWNKKFAAAGNGLGGASVWEPILVVGKPKDPKLRTDVIECMTDRVDLDGVSLRDLHSCPKPVKLYATLIEAFVEVGGGILEPFCGSGTTLVAAEQLDRRCFGMEIDPSYCDVIVKRWENLTGEKAVLADA